jgi:hypothetical protein
MEDDTKLGDGIHHKCATFQIDLIAKEGDKHSPAARVPKRQIFGSVIDRWTDNCGKELSRYHLLKIWSPEMTVWEIRVKLFFDLGKKVIVGKLEKEQESNNCETKTLHN